MTESSTFPLPRLRPGAVVYSRDTPDRGAMISFARKLQERGWRVGGVAQEAAFDETGAKIGVDSVDLLNGERVPIVRRDVKDPENKQCGLDPAALTDATSAIRHAISENVDLLVVEKFGEREQNGEGLVDDTFAAIAEGIPTLMAVPIVEIETWNGLVGNMGDLVACDEAALWRWWGPHRLYDDLLLGLEDDTIERIVVGLGWTLVATVHGCGVAQTPPKGAAGCGPLKGAQSFIGRPLSELAEKVRSTNPFEAAMGLAAVNAHYNRDDGEIEGESVNGLDVLARSEGKLCAVGRFPRLDQRFDDYDVVERNPGSGEYPTAGAQALVSRADRVLVTGSALVDHSLPTILAAAPAPAMVAVVGPSAPLAPRLFDFGIDILSGLVITDIDGAERAVAEGGGAGDLKNFGQFRTLSH